MKTISSIALILLIIGCSHPGDKQHRADLLRSDAIQREAHMTNDAALLTSQIADTLITVQDGKVTRSSNQEVKDKFSRYFESVVYRQWDNLHPPIVHISGDGTLATVVVNKITEAKDSHSPDSTYTTTTFAWTSTYQKQDDGWKIISITSTRTRP